MSRKSAGFANENATLDERVITLATGSTTLEPHKHANRLLRFSTADAAYTITMPHAYGSGDVYEFVSDIARTSGSIIINLSHGVSSNVLIGAVVNHGSGNVDVTFHAAVSNAFDRITLNITTTGGAKAGDYIRLRDVAVGVWLVEQMQVFSSGTHATSFSAP